MSGTMAGGLKTKAKILAKDPHHYEKIGAKGGQATGPKGFAVSGLARIAGAKGGTISRREGIKNGEGRQYAKQGEI